MLTLKPLDSYKLDQSKTIVHTIKMTNLCLEVNQMKSNWRKFEKNRKKVSFQYNVDLKCLFWPILNYMECRKQKLMNLSGKSS